MNRERKKRPVILLAFADEPDGRVLNQLKVERRRIEDALSEPEEAGLCQVVTAANATLDEITDKLIKYGDRLAIFHFASHASPDKLKLETDAGGSSAIYAQGFARLLSNKCPPGHCHVNRRCTEKYCPARISGARNLRPNRERSRTKQTMVCRS